MRVRMIDHASPGDVYAPTAFDGQIGKSVPVLVGGRTVMGVLTAATVVSEGRAVELTLDVPGLDLGDPPGAA